MVRDSGPYRRAATPAERAERPRLPNADIVVLFAALSPVFLAVVIRTAVRGEVFGAGHTLCGALFVLGLATAVSAWRSRS